MLRRVSAQYCDARLHCAQAVRSVVLRMSDNNMAMLTPGSAAARLNVSGAALRRMAVAYVEVYGELPEAAGGGRLWPMEAVERLEQARALLTAGRARSVRDALEALRAGAQVSVEVSAALGRDTRVLEVIAQRLEAVDRLECKVEELHSEIAALTQRQLEQGKQPDPVSDKPMSAPSIGSAEPRPGVLVRAAQRLERLFRLK